MFRSRIGVWLFSMTTLIFLSLSQEISTWYLELGHGRSACDLSSSLVALPFDAVCNVRYEGVIN